MDSRLPVDMKVARGHQGQQPPEQPRAKTMSARNISPLATTPDNAPVTTMIRVFVRGVTRQGISMCKPI